MSGRVERLSVRRTDNGIASCFDVESGKLHWRERLTGDFKASPLAADGKIYFMNRAGATTVVEATSRFKLICPK